MNSINWNLMYCAPPHREGGVIEMSFTNGNGHSEIIGELFYKNKIIQIEIYQNGDSLTECGDLDGFKLILAEAEKRMIEEVIPY